MFDELCLGLLADTWDKYSLCLFLTLKHMVSIYKAWLDRDNLFHMFMCHTLIIIIQLRYFKVLILVYSIIFMMFSAVNKKYFQSKQKQSYTNHLMIEN